MMYAPIPAFTDQMVRLKFLCNWQFFSGLTPGWSEPLGITIAAAFRGSLVNSLQVTRHCDSLTLNLDTLNVF